MYATFSFRATSSPTIVTRSTSMRPDSLCLFSLLGSALLGAHFPFSHILNGFAQLPCCPACRASGDPRFTPLFSPPRSPSPALPPRRRSVATLSCTYGPCVQRFISHTHDLFHQELFGVDTPLKAIKTPKYTVMIRRYTRIFEFDAATSLTT